MTGLQRWWRQSVQQIRMQPGRMLSLLGLSLLALVLVSYYQFYLPWLGHRNWLQARAALDRGDWKQAQDCLQVCVQVWPTSAETWVLLAQACRRGDDLEAATRHLQEAERFSKVTEDLNLERELLRVQGGNVGDGEINALARFQDTSQEYFVVEAVVKGCLKAKRFPLARAMLLRWTTRDPDNWQPWFLSGCLLQELVEPDPAAACFERGQRLKPDHPELQLRTGMLQTSTGQNLHEALAHLQRYLQADPDRVEALAALAECQRALGKIAAARATLQRLSERRQETVSTLLTRAKLDIAEENYQDALTWLQRAEARHTFGDELYFNNIYLLSIVSRQLGLSRETADYESKLTQIKEFSPQFREAMRAFLEGGNEVEARYKGGVLFLKMKQEALGESWLLTALQLDPNHAPTHRALADFYQNQNTPESRQRAEQHRRLAAEPSPLTRSVP